MVGRLDPVKDAANEGRHGVSLAAGRAIFEDVRHIILPTVRLQDGEERFKVIGTVDGKLFTRVFVWRDDLPRFMSVRRSNENEKRSYRHSG